MPVRAVIFDIGGVLLRKDDWSAQRAWEQRLGLPQGGLYRLVVSLDQNKQVSLGQITDDEVWTWVGRQLDLAAEDLAALRTDFWQGEQLDQQLADFLRGLRPRYQTAFLSNAWLSAREAVSGKFGLDSLVDVMFMSAEVGLAKPDPRFYQHALGQLGVQPTEAIFVDDVAANVAVADSLGMMGIQFIDTAQTIRDVRGALG